MTPFQKYQILNTCFEDNYTMFLPTGFGVHIFATRLCLWVFFSTSLQEHTDTKVGNCVFKRPSGGGTQAEAEVIEPRHLHIKSLYPLHLHIKSLYICIRSASRLKLQESTKSPRFKVFPFFPQHSVCGSSFLHPCKSTQTQR